MPEANEVPEGMLPGDKYTLEQWIETQTAKTESSAPAEFPLEVAEAYATFLALADKHGMPTLTIMALKEHVATQWSLTDDPANTPPLMLMLRAQASNDHIHMAKVIGPCMQLQGMPESV